MSSQTVGTNNGVQLFVKTDTSRIFLWENRYAKADFTNSQYDPLVMKAGTLLGRIAATQDLALCDSNSIDGSQYPVGVLADDVTIDEGDVKEISFCNYGDVADDKVIFHGADTMDTVVSGRSYRDRIAADTVGIRLVQSTEMTAFDNE
jgi:hypothetical protein